MPLIYQPELAPGFGDVFGLGDIQQSLRADTSLSQEGKTAVARSSSRPGVC
jgi:hypothetical protein